MILWDIDPRILAQVSGPTAPSTSGWHDAFYYVSPFVGPGLTLCIGGWWLQRLFVRRANASLFADALIKRMDEVLADSLEYWNLDSAQDVQEKRAKVLAQKIKGSLKTLDSDLRHFRGRYAQASNFDAMTESISDACTGGKFESAGRNADEVRYLMIVNSVNALKSEVLRVKL